jgi:hypothetical protein
MLWYKAWLETRGRLLLLTAMIGILLIPHLLDPRHGDLWKTLRSLSPMLCWFAAMFLAGAGVNTQTGFRNESGFHKSMLFTLSLPVSRGRLFSVRAGLGAIEACVFVLILAVATLCSAPGPLSASLCIDFVTPVLLCVLAVYALFAFLATFLDDMWRTGVGVFALFVLLIVQNRFPRVANFNPMSGMGLFSYPFSAAMPWAVVITSAAVCTIFIWLSILILRWKEY